MRIVLFISSFDLLSLTEKLLWSVATVATILLLILIVMRFLGYDLDKEPNTQSRLPWLDSNAILVFFTFFGWSSILAHLWEENMLLVVLYGLPIGLIAVTAPYIFKELRKRLPSKSPPPGTSTWKRLSPVPVRYSTISHPTSKVKVKYISTFAMRPTSSTQ